VQIRSIRGKSFRGNTFFLPLFAAMNPIFQAMYFQLLRGKMKREGRSHPGRRDILIFRIHAWRQIMHGFLMILGMLSAGLGLKGFLLPNGFIDGGVTGISLLISELSGVNLPLLIILINIPFIIVGYKQLSTEFALKTLTAIVGLALCLIFIPYPIITSDKLLVAVFGGFFLGAGIGLAVRGGSVIDGTEILALGISKRSTLSIGDVILIINLIIFAVAAFVLSYERALYSILTYFAAARTVDFLITGIEEYTGVTIVSTRSEEVRRMITEKLGRGVTIYRGKRGYGKHGHRLEEIDIIFTVVTRLEIAMLQAEIEKIDREAFIITQSIKDTKGGMIKRRPLH
jgi:uncharacterized membrane-anchored protein YitT (DUF2179 family)